LNPEDEDILRKNESLSIKLRIELQLFSYWDKTFKRYKKRLIGTINSKKFDSVVKNYDPSTRDKHIVGTQNDSEKIPEIPFVYDYNIFSISNGDY
jgi:hypothetical protein